MIDNCNYKIIILLTDKDSLSLYFSGWPPAFEISYAEYAKKEIGKFIRKYFYLTTDKNRRYISNNYYYHKITFMATNRQSLKRNS